MEFQPITLEGTPETDITAWMLEDDSDSIADIILDQLSSQEE